MGFKASAGGIRHVGQQRLRLGLEGHHIQLQLHMIREFMGFGPLLCHFLIQGTLAGIQVNPPVIIYQNGRVKGPHIILTLSQHTAGSILHIAHKIIRTRRIVGAGHANPGTVGKTVIQIEAAIGTLSHIRRPELIFSIGIGRILDSAENHALISPG